MLIPAEEVVVLELLLVSHLQEVIVELGEHVEVCESNMSSHEEGPLLQVFLKVLTNHINTFRSSLPSFRWVLISAISVLSSPSPKKNVLH